jgi:hypothetical protein
MGLYDNPVKIQSFAAAVDLARTCAATPTIISTCPYGLDTNRVPLVNRAASVRNNGVVKQSRYRVVSCSVGSALLSPAIPAVRRFNRLGARAGLSS